MIAKEKNGGASKRRRPSKTTLARMSASMKRYWANREHLPLTPRHKARISKAIKLRWANRTPGVHHSTMPGKKRNTAPK